MTKFFLKIHDTLCKHRLATAIVLLLAVAGMVVLAIRLDYEEDIAKFLPREKDNEKYVQIYEQIAQQDKIAVIFTSRDSTRQLPVENLETAMQQFATLMAEHGIGNVQATVDEEKTMEMIEFVYQNAPYFLTDADYERIDSLLKQPNYIASQLVQDKKMLMLPTASMMTEGMRYDPLHLFGPMLARLQSLKMSDKLSLVDGYIFTADGKHGLVYFSSKTGASESGKNAELGKKLDSVMHTVMHDNKGVKVTAIGGPLIAVTNAEQIKSDSLRAMAIAVTVILILLMMHYRSVPDLLWIGASLIFGWLLAIAGMAVFGHSVSIIVLGIGSVIIGIAVNYPLHFLDHMREESDQRQALKEMVPPLLTGNITTVAAFLCLVWLDAAAMRDLGIFGALMLIGTIMFVLVFLPLYVKKHSIARRHLDFNINTITFGNRSQKRWFVGIVTALTLVLGWLSLRTTFDSNMGHINYMTPEQRADLEMLSSLSGTTDLYAVAQGRSLDEALEANARLQSQLESLHDVEGVKGVGNFVPSRAEQERRLKKWHDYWKPRAAVLVAHLDEQAALQGFAPGVFSSFVDMVSSKHAVVPSSYFAPVTSQLAGSYMLSKKSDVKIISYLTLAKSSQEDAVKSTLRNTATKTGNILVFSPKDVSNQLANVLNDNFNYISYVCGFVVFFFLWFSFGSIELSLISFLPLAVGWLWILGIMQLLGIQFNIVNIILATFIFGQGDDYTIFITEGCIYEYAYGKKRLDKYTGSVVLSAVIMFVGIGALIISKHPALRSLAEVTIVGMFTVVFMAYCLPPLIFDWFTRKQGSIRPMPITLKRLGRSLWAGFYFAFMSTCVLKPYVAIFFALYGETNAARDRYHRRLLKIARWVCKHTLGVEGHVENAVGETFEKPAIIISNHQSHLDIMHLMQLTSKIVFFTNDWTWNNPYYGYVIHKAEFLPVTRGLDNNMAKIKDLYARGYSICIFPEGTRSADGRIMRFHKGAFYLAQQLGADIVPVMLHGASDALPKKDFMLRKGRITVVVGPRLKSGDMSMGATYQERTKAYHRMYLAHFEQLRNRIELSDYWSDMVKHQYYYKGAAVTRRCSKNLKRHNNYSAWVDDQANRDLKAVAIHNCGQGEMPWIFALVNRHCQVYAFTRDDDDYALLRNMVNAPANLHFLREGSPCPDAEDCDKTITLNNDE